MEVMDLGLQSLWLNDFTNLNAGFPLDFANETPLGFGNGIVPLPFLGGQQGFAGWDDWQFGPELGPKFLRNFRTYPLDTDSDKKRRRGRRHHYHYEHERQRDHHHHSREKRSYRVDGVEPRADGPGYYDSAHYDNDRSPIPTPDAPPPAPPPPPVSSSTNSSQHDVSDAGVPPDAEEVASQSSHSSHDTSVSSHSDSDTPVYREPERPKDRGRTKEKKKAQNYPSHSNRRHHHHHHAPPQEVVHHRRHHSPDDFYQVERARRISPERSPPSYEEYQRRFRRRSLSPVSITTRSSSAESSQYRGYTLKNLPRHSFGDTIHRRKLFDAASRCTGDYLTRIKIEAPRQRVSPPWVESISDVFYKMGFTIIDVVFEEREGIVTILAPPELVARKINKLHPDIQTAITSIRAARVCRNDGGYNLQVW